MPSAGSYVCVIGVSSHIPAGMLGATDNDVKQFGYICWSFSLDYQRQALSNAQIGYFDAGDAMSAGKIEVERKGLPGLRGTDHIGFTVPDLDEAVTFFVDVLGCEAFYDLGPFQSDTDWMATHLDVHPRTVMKRLRFLRCRHGSNFELFEYDAPDQRSPAAEEQRHRRAPPRLLCR